MKKITYLIGIILSFLVLYVQQSFCCTSFCLRDHKKIIVGNNKDDNVDYGYWMINKRNVKKTAILLSHDKPAIWITKYGSITHNQSKESPRGGMNEAGLVVEALTLFATQYPAPDERAAVWIGSWIQYQLDNSASIQDVMESDKHIRITNTPELLAHFIVVDSAGNTLVVEFLNGKAKFYYGDNLPEECLTNDTYASEIKNFKKYKYESPSRFATVAYMLDNYKSDNDNSIIDYSYSILDSVRSGNTQDQIVYDIGERRIYFRTHVSPQIKTVDLSRFNFNCDSPIMMIDANASYKGDVNDKFVPFDTKINRDYTIKICHDFGLGVPMEMILELIKRSENVICNQK
ncbi:MAG: linear amide C-N hydrolase [Bacteroidota bacterium]|jgi:choloylglycine hydrolase